MDKAIEATDDSIIRRIHHFACWITKATDTHTDYGILNATTVTRHSNVTLYIQCLYCLHILYDICYLFTAIGFPPSGSGR